jgi:hypothetical protein
MSAFILHVKEVHFTSDLQVPVTASRAFVDAQFLTTGGYPIRVLCHADSGAPLCVVPFSLWHDCNLRWQNLGAHLTVSGKLVPEALTWQGIPCDLGCTRVEMFDHDGNLFAGAYLVVGKFPQNPHSQPEIENMPILGLNFLTDNRLGGVLRRHTRQFGSKLPRLTACGDLPMRLNPDFP